MVLSGWHLALAQPSPDCFFFNPRVAVDCGNASFVSA
jgi:hypothetical protein